MEFSFLQNFGKLLQRVRKLENGAWKVGFVLSALFAKTLQIVLTIDDSSSFLKLVV